MYLYIDIIDYNDHIISEPTARSAVPGVSPGRGLLIPLGYLHPVNASIAKSKVILHYVMDGRRWMVFVVMRMHEYKPRVDWYLSSS